MFAFTLACIFFFSLRYGFGMIDSPKFFGIIAFVTIYMLCEPEREISPTDFSVFMLFIVYFWIAVYEHMFLEGQNKIYSVLPYAWVMPTTYMTGKLIVGTKKKELSNKCFIVIVVITAGAYIQACLNYLGGLIFDVYGRSHQTWRSFWNAGVDGTRNHWNYGFLFIVGALFFAVLVRKNKKKFSAIVFLLILICIVINVLTAGRTMPLMVILSFSIMGFIYIISNRETLSSKLKKSLLLIFILAVILVMSFMILMHMNFMGIGKWYSGIDYFNRDGGIFNNIRFRILGYGVKRAFLLKKGGWDLTDKWYAATTHNSWLEYARYYDIIVFLLMAVFLIVLLFNSIKLLLRYGNEFKILYYLSAVVILIVIYGFFEPALIMNHDLVLFLFFVYGMIMGIGDVACHGEYKLHSAKISNNMRNRAFFGFAIISITLITTGYMDWWHGRYIIFVPIIIPTIAYIVGMIAVRRKHQITLLILAGIVSLLAAVYTYFISIHGEYYSAGFYIEPITGLVVEKSVFNSLLILPISIVVGYIMYRFKLNKTLFAVLITGISFIILLPVIKDGRIGQMKEALRLQLNMVSGAQWIQSRENYTGLITSHSMWLDFARDYGVLILILLLVFEIWSFYCFVKIVTNNKKDIVEYILIVAFILFNFHFMLESTAITSKYIFAMGLFVYGMISVDGEEQNNY